MWPWLQVNTAWPMMMEDGLDQVLVHVFIIVHLLNISPLTVTKSESLISERLSSPRLSQKSSSVSKRTSTPFLAKSESTIIAPGPSQQCLKREECGLIRILANAHCLLSEVYIIKCIHACIYDRALPSVWYTIFNKKALPWESSLLL